MLKWLSHAAVLVAIGVMIAGCSSSKQASRDPFAGQGSPVYPGKGDVPWGGGRYHVGKPYQIAGRWYEPKEQPGYDKKGMASWYGEAFDRRKTSNGEWFDKTRLTAAHPTLPLPSYVKVTNLENGREVIVRVNDRGPFVGTRLIDMSKASAIALDFKNQGKAKVRVQYIGPAPLEDDGRHLYAMNNELDRGTPLRKMIARADKLKGNAPSGKTMVAVAKPLPKRAPSQPVVQLVATDSNAQQVAAEGTLPSSGDVEVSYYVQIGSFSDGQNATRVREQFAAVWPVQFIELSGASGPVFRVRLGPISHGDDAETALADARAAGFGDARLVRSQSVQAALQ